MWKHFFIFFIFVLCLSSTLQKEGKWYVWMCVVWLLYQLGEQEQRPLICYGNIWFITRDPLTISSLSLLLFFIYNYIFSLNFTT